VPYPENKPDNPPVSTAGHLIISMRNGQANDVATSEMEKLVKAIQESHDDKASGHVTIKIKVSKLKDGETELKVDMKVTSSIPVPAIPAGIYYPNDKGELFRTDPRQMSLLDDRRDGDISRVGRGETIDA
jgi:hypothetical protein